MILRDSTDPFAIPLDGLDAVAGYADGLYEWSSAGWARFQPPIVSLSIVVNPLDQGDIADVETGDLTPANCPGWVQRFNRPHRRAPTLYVSRGEWPNVVGALDGSGIDPNGIDWWIATLDGTLDVFFGQRGVPPPASFRVVAVQFKDFGGYDESVILDPTWIGVTMLDPNDPIVQKLLDSSNKINQLWQDLSATVDPGGRTVGQVLLDVSNGVVALEKAVVASGSNKPVLDAIAALKADLDALTLKKA